MHDQDFDPTPEFPQTQSKPNPQLYSVDYEDNVMVEEGDDKSITLRKSIRTCTQHPIQNFLSYGS
ncbi:hypothetical protein, partial [Heyndrickxia coagulans]|uniref:hypothetical protein n=1 Tax=Heyndrickxia coagulans TaxID=1398 RepID=UPI00214D927E